MKYSEFLEKAGEEVRLYKLTHNITRRVFENWILDFKSFYNTKNELELSVGSGDYIFKLSCDYNPIFDKKDNIFEKLFFRMTGIINSNNIITTMIEMRGNYSEKRI